MKGLIKAFALVIAQIAKIIYLIIRAFNNLNAKLFMKYKYAVSPSEKEKLADDKKALVDAGYPNVPVISLTLGSGIKNEQPASTFSFRCFISSF